MFASPLALGNNTGFIPVSGFQSAGFPLGASNAAGFMSFPADPTALLFGPGFGLPTAQPPQPSVSPTQLVMALLLRELLQGSGRISIGQSGGGPIGVPGVRPVPPETGPRTPRPTGGGEKTTFDNGALQLSQAALEKIWRSPDQIKDVINQELVAVTGSNSYSALVKKLTGVDIKTGFSEERKTIKAYQLYNDILNNLTKQIRDGYGFENVPLAAPETSVLKPGGVQFSKAVQDQLRATPDNTKAIITKALEDATGTTDKAALVAKIVGVNRLDSGGLKTFADELYGYILDYAVKNGVNA